VALISINKHITPEATFVCEKCGSYENLQVQNVAGIYRTVLCTRCWREWEKYALDLPDSKLLSAVNKFYREFDVTASEKADLISLSNDIVQEFKPILDNWLNGGKEDGNV